ncbi:MAG: hypothetical protein ACLFU8_07405 [Anaerolineales bacterium]
MPAARDIALIFLSLEALVVALVPLVLFAALAYATYRLRLLVREYLRLAFTYVEKGREAVEGFSRSVVKPLIQVQSTWRMVQTILTHLIPRRVS